MGKKRNRNYPVIAMPWDMVSHASMLPEITFDQILKKRNHRVFSLKTTRPRESISAVSPSTGSLRTATFKSARHRYRFRSAAETVLSFLRDCPCFTSTDISQRAQCSEYLWPARAIRWSLDEGIEGAYLPRNRLLRSSSKGLMRRGISLSESLATA